MNKLLYYETHQSEHSEWLVLVHGAGGSTRTWKRQIKELGVRYNLLVMDLPGHGQNRDRDLGLPEYSFEIIASKIWELVDHLKISSVHLVGISLGTILCLEMRLLHPNRVLSLILPGAIISLNTKLKVLANVSLFIAKIIGYRNLYKMSAHIMMPRGNHKQSRDVFINESKALTIGEFKKWTQLYYNLNKTLQNLGNQKTDTPQLLVMGGQDHLFLLAAQKFADQQDQTSIKIIAKCGHVVSIECASVFNEICLDFLEKTSD